MSDGKREGESYLLDAGDVDAPDVPAELWKGARARFRRSWESPPSLAEDRANMSGTSRSSLSRSGLTLEQLLTGPLDDLD